MQPTYFEIGKILSPRGLAGELRVYPLTDEPSRFALLDEVLIEFPPVVREGARAGSEISQTRGSARAARVYPVKSARVHKGLVLLKLAGVDDVSAAEKLRGALVKIPPEKALPLDEGQYYVRDLIGLEVVTDNDEVLGALTEVLHTKANDVYVIGGKLMIPAVKECVLHVDIEGKRMIVALPKGLR